ncbi:MAG TPA: hypothetical protein VFU02_10255 [Polyangiaceae bacterium]|nr:hypothetical protein [Polyangiaceae bacterium]
MDLARLRTLLAATALLPACSLAPLEAAVPARAYPVLSCDPRPRMAVASEVVQAPECREPRAMPDTVGEAKAGERERLERVLRAWLATFQGRWDDFGDWERDGTRTGLRKVMAGLKALQVLPAHDRDRPPDEFPGLAEHWIVEHARAHRRAGTDTWHSPVGGVKGDYDFTMLQILELIYHFRGQPELLGNDAIWALLKNEQYADRLGRGRRLRLRIPDVGNTPHRMTFEVLAEFPETENHVLMVNAWAYLVNQWLERDYRRDSRVRRYFAEDPSRYRNEGSSLERVLLSVLSRPLHADFFETNSRPYSAYTLRVLQLLASYSDASTPGGRKVRVAALNALDYAATRFAFQSFQGKRYGPSRRNYRYRALLGVYSGDYVPQLFGVLTGVHTYDDDPECQGSACAYANPQARGFALESALSQYRVPETIWDFMLHPDNHRAGHGVWVRAQPRYTERHYLQGKWPRYPGSLPDLAHAVRTGETALEPAPEFYFITQEYMNSAGGRAEHYGGMDAWLPASLRRANDLLAKPSSLLLPGDSGYWREWSDLEESTLVFRGDEKQHWASNNTGVYKNLVYGYFTGDRSWPMNLPSTWSVSRNRQLGALTLRVIDLSSNNGVSNPDFGIYVVLGRFPRLPGAALTGFWEVIPEARFEALEQVWDCVVRQNQARDFPDGGPYHYSLCLSGDELSLNPRFGRREDPFLAINESSDALAREHIDLSDLDGVAQFPLLEAREVDDHYRYTGTTYALARGDGRLTVRNPALGKTLILDSSNPNEPRRSGELDTGRRAPDP